MTKRIKLELTHQQVGTMLNLLADFVHDLDDYSFEDGQSEKQRIDEKAYYTRIYNDLNRAYTAHYNKVVSQMNVELTK